MNELKITIIGLGYIGLPLAISLSKYFDTIGYDKNFKRISELKSGFDRTGEISKLELKKKSKLNFTNNLKDTRSSKVYIVAVPSPIKKNK